MLEHKHILNTSSAPSGLPKFLAMENIAPATIVEIGKRIRCTIPYSFPVYGFDWRHQFSPLSVYQMGAFVENKRFKSVKFDR